MIERGQRVREVLKQREGEPQSALEQLAVLRAVVAGVFDAIPLEVVAAGEQAIRAAVRAGHGDLDAMIEAGECLADADWRAVIATATQAVETLARRAEAQ